MSMLKAHFKKWILVYWDVKISACMCDCVCTSVLVSNCCWVSRTPPTSLQSAGPRGPPPPLEPETNKTNLSKVGFAVILFSLYNSVALGLYTKAAISSKFAKWATSCLYGFWKQLSAAWKTVVRQILSQISLKFPTHLPVDVVLKADCVRRGTVNWQLQNKTWAEK